MIKGYKVPICVKCGRKVIGRIPVDVEFTCFFCKFPNTKDPEDDHTDTNWSDKRE